MPQTGAGRSPSGSPKTNSFGDYVTVAERVEKFYERYPDGRITSHIVEHDAERGFILMRAEVFRRVDDAQPAATGHAYELKSEGYVQRTSYIEVCETSAIGRALAMAGFEVRRGIASQEEMEKARNHQAAAARSKQPPEAPASDDQKQAILTLLEQVKPGDRRAQRSLLQEKTGKDSRDDLTQKEAAGLISTLQKQAGSAPPEEAGNAEVPTVAASGQ